MVLAHDKMRKEAFENASDGSFLPVQNKSDEAEKPKGEKKGGAGQELAFKDKTHRLLFQNTHDELPR